MNFLAHIFLSGNDPEVKLGNFFGDFVKGSSYNNFPERIKKGILLHRRIDEFTDNHIEFKKSVNLLKPRFGRYSGIMADMYYDHFLAADFHNYSSVSLNCFAYNFYMHALLRYPLLPTRIKRFIFHFAGSNRLRKYASKEGLQESLEIMRNRKSAAFQPELAIEVLTEYCNELESHFQYFFPEIIQFADSELNKQLNQHS